MREIKFRGKLMLGKHSWVKGFYVRVNDNHVIIPGGINSLLDYKRCDPETIGQFTGLQDISDEDCRKEGIIPVTWRQYPEPFSHHYVDHDLWTLEKYREQFEDTWSDDDPEVWAATSPKAAFAVLIRKLQGKKAWERNEWQFAYTFKLIR